MNIAFLGPEASFTSLAAAQLFSEGTLLPQTNIRDCFLAVASGEADRAVVPLENSIEGTVSLTLDYLYDFPEIYILAEAVMPIAHHLMVHPEQTSFQKVLSHPQALAQCFHFLEAQYKSIPRQDFHSTAASAKYVSEHPEEQAAAIANAYAAQLYGLKILHHHIHDFEQNHTKFIVISKSSEEIKFQLPVKSEKTSLLITIPKDDAGGLHQVLSVFAWRKMNLSKIESRTLKIGLGNYFFFINVDGKWDNVLYQNSLEELKSIGVMVKFLGHYEEYHLEG